VKIAMQRQGVLRVLARSVLHDDLHDAAVLYPEMVPPELLHGAQFDRGTCHAFPHAVLDARHSALPGPAA